jgi:sarcosine oxidase
MTRVAVVGAGIMGAATAWQLARRGAEVTVYEQFDLDHDRGSSHGRSRIFRVAYPDPDWVRLAEESYAGWKELDPGLLDLYGLIELAPDRALTSAAALEECGLPHRFLAAAEARELGTAPPEGWSALFVPDAGIVHADKARHAFLEGIDVRYRSPVADLDALDADVVVLTAGSWIGRFFGDLPLTVTRETVAYFRQESAPPSVVELDERSAHAMFSLHDPVYGLKAGAHHAGVEADPDEPGEPDPELVERISAWVAERLPLADPEPVGAETCLYTTTPDERFVLERRGRVVIGSACSGHGFKFAPAVGARLAALAFGREDDGR